ncbi:hypothetical protein TVAG_365550 [Trichomonas vaginalis G3]|uniref:Uncharacterized protein n=1 Tax=Trichomonas vaginalis (strain ATCC PRA-98 / G3) TaxID=412133 RepID=A2DHJ9_TRIV3|nr:armadillo (ARM) repeat-containing protein family [Trichomonas vaginalis G3]EAY20047.1 hypothetical protein TVAG_365550 [Trichomonas vaginalis G3]KAI5527998.1 armadillo (ARM) repeat-containing protein family [Trichomonas vaginalis G3]|eukprot:XP_001581033.1 hypothetical protein [Trichomonas vaginalis G3]
MTTIEYKVENDDITAKSLNKESNLESNTKIVDDSLTIFEEIQREWLAENETNIIQIFGQVSRDTIANGVKIQFVEQVLETNVFSILETILDSNKEAEKMQCIEFINALCYSDERFIEIFLNENFMNLFVQIFNSEIQNINRLSLLFNNMTIDHPDICEFLANSLNFNQIFDFIAKFPDSSWGSIYLFIERNIQTLIGYNFAQILIQKIIDPKTPQDSIKFAAVMIRMFCSIEQFQELCLENNVFPIFKNIFFDLLKEPDFDKIDHCLEILMHTFKPEIHQFDLPVFENIIILKDEIYPSILYMMSKYIDVQKEFSDVVSAGFINYLIENLTNVKSAVYQEIVVFICIVGINCSQETLEMIIDSGFLEDAIDIFQWAQDVTYILPFYHVALEKILNEQGKDAFLQIVDEISILESISPCLESENEEVRECTNILYSFITSVIESE